MGLWRNGSAGALQAQGWGFESLLLHQLIGDYANLVDGSAWDREAVGSSPASPTIWGVNTDLGFQLPPTERLVIKFTSTIWYVA